MIAMCDSLKRLEIKVDLGHAIAIVAAAAKSAPWASLVDNPIVPALRSAVSNDLFVRLISPHRGDRSVSYLIAHDSQ
jgi:hypothetical protein